MEDTIKTFIIYILAPLLTTGLGGLGWYIKKTLSKRDERRDRIECRISELENDIMQLVTMLYSCEHKDCKVKPQFIDYMKNKTNRNKLS